MSVIDGPRLCEVRMNERSWKHIVINQLYKDVLINHGQLTRDDTNLYWTIDAARYHITPRDGFCVYQLLYCYGCV